MFSGIVKIADIDDYISPSQNCIKPISEASLIKEVSNSDKSKKNEIKSKKQKLVIGINSNSTDELNDFLEPDLIKLKNPETRTAKISLNDCLACSGCVTTAETLLIQALSVDEFLKKSKLEKNVSICLISPQSILSLSYFFDMDENETLDKLCLILEEVGIKFVLNYNTILKFCMDKSYEEFKEKILIEKKQSYLISSECPGWICYAEKKIGEWIIPYLSNVKSPQQILGNFLKNSFKKLFENKDIYLTAIMPCFDKKLEATRENNKIDKDFLEVDTVISTIEILELFGKLDINFLDYKPTRKQRVFYTFTNLVKLLYDNDCSIESEEKMKEKQNNSNNKEFFFINKINSQIIEKDKDIDSNNSSEPIFNENTEKDKDNLILNYFYENYDRINLLYPTKDNSSFFFSDINFSSNGYVEYIMGELIKEKKKHNQDINFEILRKNMKNSDYKEIELKFYNQDLLDSTFSFAIIYGFRNIQNLIRNKSKIKYQYLEIMACPGGCINGGGQIRPKDHNNESSRDILRKIEDKLNLNIKNFLKNKNIENFLLNEKKYLDIFLENNFDINYTTAFRAIEKSPNVFVKW